MWAALSLIRTALSLSFSLLSTTLGFWRHALQSVADLHGSVAAPAKVSPSQYFYGHLVTRESVLPCNFSQPLSGTRVRARNRLTALSMF
jgi:hypothetical protein